MNDTTLRRQTGCYVWRGVVKMCCGGGGKWAQ